MPEEYSF